MTLIFIWITAASVTAVILILLLFWIAGRYFGDE
jgi:hypothetical protein